MHVHWGRQARAGGGNGGPMMGQPLEKSDSTNFRKESKVTFTFDSSFFD